MLKDFKKPIAKIPDNEKIVGGTVANCYLNPKFKRGNKKKKPKETFSNFIKKIFN